MKKILSLVLIVATLASLVVFVPTAGAAQTDAKAIVETTNAVAKAGDTVTVDLIITAAEGNEDTVLKGFMLNFHYDKTRLKLVKVPAVPVDLNAKVLIDGATNTCQDNGEALWQWNGDNAEKDVNGDGEADGDAFALFENVSSAFPTNPIDIADGYTVATITFEVLDNAPIGDAFVEFCQVGGELHSNMNAVSGDKFGEPGEIEYRASKITVLPEDATMVPADSPVGQFTFTDNGDGTSSVKSYNGSDATVVIPSVDGNGRTVVGILLGAFKANQSITTLYVPATVTSIATGAVGNCDFLKAVYLLGDVVEYQTAAIGWKGTYVAGGRGKPDSFTPEFVNYDSVTWETITTIYCGAGNAKSVIEGDADGDKYTVIVADRPFLVTAAGVSYFAPASTTAPGVGLTEDGKTIIAWKNGSDAVPAGAPMTLAADTVLEPVAVSMATNTTHSMKLSDAENLGMRFTSTLSYADYAAMVSLAKDGKQDFVKLGMIITPNQYVERAGAFTKAALNTIGAANGAYVDVAINGYYEKDDVNSVYTLAASLVGYSKKTLANNIAFAAVTYAEIDTNGDGNADITVYGQYDLATVRSVKDVALSVKNATYPEGEGLTGEQIGWLETLLGKIGA